MSKTQAKSPAKVPKYKLTYFNVRGRAEHTRMLFAAAGVEFEDCRIKKEDWAKLKEEVPQKTLPVLDIDGKTRLTQSYAIARYVAREYGFYGKTNLEAAHIDSLLDTILDIFQAAIPGFMEKDETKKAELRKKLESEDVPKYFGFIDTAIGKFGKDGFAVPSGLTIADIILFNVTDFLRLQEHAAKYSNIAKSRKHVQEHPKLKKYLAERPDSEF